MAFGSSIVGTMHVVRGVWLCVVRTQAREGPRAPHVLLLAKRHQRRIIAPICAWRNQSPKISLSADVTPPRK